MSESMKDIKRRIKSARSTVQITGAMQLVASSKLRKAMARAESIRPYFMTIYDTLSRIASDNKGFSSEYISDKESRKPGYIVIAGDRGLAGGYNANIFKAADELAVGEKSAFYPIGKKSVEYFGKKQNEILWDYSDPLELFSFRNSSDLSKQIIKDFESGKIDSVSLVYTRFVNAITQRAQVIRVLPFRPGELSGNKRAIMEFDPSPDSVFHSILPQYLSGVLYGAVCESFASEQASRRNAMQNASDNGKKMIEDLGLSYNRARQAAITEEISEIVAGAAASNM